MRRKILVLVCSLLVAGGIAPARAEVVTCSGAAPGGEWRRSGGDLANSRSQPAESVLNAGSVANVGLEWKFDSVIDGGGSGDFQNTPVVADGCIYLASSSGWVFALNAETGKKVWGRRMAGEAAGSLQGGVITGSPTVENGLVYVAVARYFRSNAPRADGSPDGPYVAALNQSDGSVAWITPVMGPDALRQYENTVVSAPVVVNGLLFQGIMGSESQGIAGDGALKPRGGYAILNATDGTLITQEWTITDAEYAAGYYGASVWCTAAADAAAGYVYACGGNPASGRLESRYSNALLKIDIDPARTATFGKIVSAYKGQTDNYSQAGYRQPVCDTFDKDIAVIWSQACLQLDLDFGASPNLFTVDVGGEPQTMIGDLQKSGVYHALYANDQNMEYAWSSIVGPPFFAANAASAAFDGRNIYTASSPPGQMFSLAKDSGAFTWPAPVPVGQGTHFQPVSTANGVVYSMNNAGELIALDAATGLTLLRRALALDTGVSAAATSSQGVAIARNTIYAASSTQVVAYR